MPEYVALVRGVNVGGRNKMPMRELADLFAAAGCANVQTYLQSGNVLFDATEEKAEEIPETIVLTINEHFGYRLSLVVRTAKQMAEVVARNPFLRQDAPEETLHVLFLAHRPDAELIERLDPNRSPGDQFVVRDQEVYLKLPHGVARSKLTNNYFDSKLGTYTTQRNWRTVNKVLDLMDE